MAINNGYLLPIHSSGQGLLLTPNKKLPLNSLLHIPYISHNFISVQWLSLDNSCSISFNSFGFSIKDSKTSQVLLHGPLNQGLYHIKPSKTSLVAYTNLTTTSSLWHRRFDHLHLSSSPSSMSLLYAQLTTTSIAMLQRAIEFLFLVLVILHMFLDI